MDGQTHSEVIRLVFEVDGSKMPDQAAQAQRAVNDRLRQQPGSPHTPSKPSDQVRPEEIRNLANTANQQARAITDLLRQASGAMGLGYRMPFHLPSYAIQGIIKGIVSQSTRAVTSAVAPVPVKTTRPDRPESPITELHRRSNEAVESVAKAWKGFTPKSLFDYMKSQGATSMADVMGRLPGIESRIRPASPVAVAKRAVGSRAMGNLTPQELALAEEYFAKWGSGSDKAIGEMRRNISQSTTGGKLSIPGKLGDMNQGYIAAYKKIAAEMGFDLGAPAGDRSLPLVHFPMSKSASGTTAEVKETVKSVANAVKEAVGTVRSSMASGAGGTGGGGWGPPAGAAGDEGNMWDRYRGNGSGKKSRFARFFDYLGNNNSIVKLGTQNVEGGISGVKGDAKSVWGAFKGNSGTLGERLGAVSGPLTRLGLAATGVVSSLVALGSGIKQMVAGVVEGTKAFISGNASQALHGAVSFLQGAVKIAGVAVGVALMAFVGPIGLALGALLGEVASKVVGQLHKFIDFMDGLVESLGQFSPVISAELAQYEVMQMMFRFKMAQVFAPAMEAWIQLKLHVLDMLATHPRIINSLVNMLINLTNALTKVFDFFIWFSDMIGAVIDACKNLVKSLHWFYETVQIIASLLLDPVNTLNWAFKALAQGIFVLMAKIAEVTPGMDQKKWQKRADDMGKEVEASKPLLVRMIDTQDNGAAGGNTGESLGAKTQASIDNYNNSLNALSWSKTGATEKSGGSRLPKNLVGHNPFTHNNYAQILAAPYKPIVGPLSNADDQRAAIETVFKSRNRQILDDVDNGRATRDQAFQRSIELEKWYKLQLDLVKHGKTTDAMKIARGITTTDHIDAKLNKFFNPIENGAAVHAATSVAGLMAGVTGISNAPGDTVSDLKSKIAAIYKEADDTIGKYQASHPRNDRSYVGAIESIEADAKKKAQPFQDELDRQLFNKSQTGPGTVRRVQSPNQTYLDTLKTTDPTELQRKIDASLDKFFAPIDRKFPTPRPALTQVDISNQFTMQIQHEEAVERSVAQVRDRLLNAMDTASQETALFGSMLDGSILNTSV